MSDGKSSETGGPRAILGLARSLLSDLDLETVLERIAEAARQLTGARYAAIGVLDGSGTRLERFITVGIDQETRREIGPPPVGQGVLGELIRDPRPLRLASVKRHPRSYGFPIGHPPMERFLGVPIALEGRAFGNLYLADKADSDFTEDDEFAVVTLAGFAAIAIDHAQRMTRSQGRATELERTVEALDATVQIAQALAGETDAQAVMDLVVKRGRALADAAGAAIERVDDDGARIVAAVAGDLPRTLRGRPLDLERKAVHEVDLVFRGRLLAVLVLFGPINGRDELGDGSQRLLSAFASSAATALATALAVGRHERSDVLPALERVWRMLDGAREEPTADALRAVVADAADELAAVCAAIRGFPPDDA